MRVATLTCCMLIGLCPLVIVAGDWPADQIIGLCYRDGSKDLVLEEIFRDEGIPYARIHDLRKLSKSGLKGLILGEGFNNSADEIESYVEKGGVVLSLKPAGRLAESLGLKNVGVQQDGCLTVGGAAASLISYQGRLQLFGEANQIEGGENLAALGSDEKFAGLARVKRGDGTALAVAFDLPTTMLTILQPKSEEVGAASDATNVQYDLGEVPQVDLLRRLIVGAFLESLDVPIARKWYFPSRYMAMLIPSGDQDWATFEQMKKVVSDVGGAVAGVRPHCCRWETCAHLPAWSEKIGLQYESILGLKLWDTKPVKVGYWVGTGLPYHVIDEQNHRRLDFLEIPLYGIDNLDFWNPDGSTLTYKEGGKPLKLAGLGLDEEESFQLSKRMIDLAMEKYHTVYSYCWHPHYLAARKLKQPINTTDAHFRKTINYAKSRGMGLIGTNAMNDFWRARENVSMTDIAWNPRSATLRYKVAGASKLNGLTMVAPRWYRGKEAKVWVNSERREHAAASIFGGQYAMWTVDVCGEPLSIAIRYER
ncbi:MAG: hypothetical protein JW829_19145 [Pirellulales bacterium]|nr:hypothetical protein [Pirellulales bacterium]